MAEPFKRTDAASSGGWVAPLASPPASGPPPTGGPNATPDAGVWLDGAWAVLDSTGRIGAANDILAGWFDSEVTNLVGDDFWRRLAGRCPGQDAALAALRAAPGPFREGLFHSLQPGGQRSHLRLEIVEGERGCCVRLESVLPAGPELEERDADELPAAAAARRQLWVRLVRAEAQLKLLTEQWPGVIFSQRADFTYRFVSPQIEELTGLAPTEWGRRPELFWQVVHEADVAVLREHLAAARERREPVVLTYRIRHARTGRIRYVLEHRRLSLSPGGLVLGSEGVWLDVTRQTLAERRLSSAAWKESLSTLTMGLAHDFGNVMAGIHALVESCLDQAGVAPELAGDLQMVKANSREASQLVHQIIDLHQSRLGELYYHDLNELVAHLAGLARKIIPRRMRFAFERCPQPLPVHVDAVEFRQVMLGLVLNAVEAMAPDGRLVLRTTSFVATPPAARQWGGLARWPGAGLTIADDGGGIAPENLARLGEPFFTTKPGGGGFGLGLYNARVYVERHGGQISVETKPGAGSAFTLVFPEADFAEMPPTWPAPRTPVVSP